MTALVDVVPGVGEVAGVPRVRNVAVVVGSVGGVGMVQQERYFALRVAVGEAAQVVEVFIVHAYNHVVVVVVGECDATGGLAVAGYAVAGQFAASRRIDGVAEFLAGGGGRGNLEMLGESGLSHQLFHTEFCHRATADIAMADEKDTSGFHKRGRIVA